MGSITSRNRNIPGIDGLPEGARILDRIARPLTGLEVKEALVRHALELSKSLTLEPQVLEKFDKELEMALNRPAELQKLNLVYPGVGWHLKLVLERLGDKTWIYGEIELDLQPNVRRNLVIGIQGRGVEDRTIEEEQIQTKAPDQLRAQRGLPVEVDWVKPDTGERGKARMARSVDIGGGGARGPEIARELEGLATPAEEKEARLNLQPQPEQVTPAELVIPEAPVTSAAPVELPMDDLASSVPLVAKAPAKPRAKVLEAKKK